MTSRKNPLAYRRLRAPRENRSVLIEPAWNEVDAQIASNTQLYAQYDYDFQGRSYAKLAQQAQSELLSEAFRWTSAYRDIANPLGTKENSPIFLAGHQPQLFHPGVWLKNFALDTLARRHRAVAINLVVDSDTVKSTALLVPGESVTSPSVASIAFDSTAPLVPYEERNITDRNLFASFGSRVLSQIDPLLDGSLVRRYWPMVQEHSRQTSNLGVCICQPRHRLEAEWGLSTLEVPQSRLCQTESFAWFVAHLLAQIDRFRRVYNEAIEEYRQVHRIRNAAHPVPNLASEEEWQETPFWIWTTEDPRRRPLFVRHTSGRILLSDRHSLEKDLHLSPEGDASRAVAQLLDYGSQGIKIRCRALLTTLWARLLLGQWFIHGIGGAKYDQVTDSLMARFFGITPPAFHIVSGTLHLPIAREPVEPDEVRAIDKHLRGLRYHPERYIGSEESSPTETTKKQTELLAAKLQWIKEPKTKQNAQRRHREIERINAALQPWVDASRRQLLARRQKVLRSLDTQRILCWREYASCLHPEETLREFLLHSFS